MCDGSNNGIQGNIIVPFGQQIISNIILQIAFQGPLARNYPTFFTDNIPNSIILLGASTVFDAAAAYKTNGGAVGEASGKMNHFYNVLKTLLTTSILPAQHLVEAYTRAKQAIATQGWYVIHSLWSCDSHHINSYILL